ncbi:hypothetical protein J7L18_02400 [Candidatus Bathyarchaeota archaeon]|nr:hypothetical protein [Candidatus Bathyarchaeota archaeon]
MRIWKRRVFIGIRKNAREYAHLRRSISRRSECLNAGGLWIVDRSSAHRSVSKFIQKIKRWNQRAFRHNHASIYTKFFSAERLRCTLPAKLIYGQS